MSKIIGVICARSGSKGVVNKNIRSLFGIPLLAHSIKTAASSLKIDIVVVTSDSQDYLDLAKDYGADYIVLRPTDLAKDNVSKLGAIEHAVSSVEEKEKKVFDVIVDLDVTSPLRDVSDVDGAIQLFLDKGAMSVITGTPSHRSPYSNLVEMDDQGVVDVSKPSDKVINRRQESPVCYDMNASVYVWDRKVFKFDPKVFYSKTYLYEMPFERSWDIDHEIDFEIVEMLMSKKNSAEEVL